MLLGRQGVKQRQGAGAKEAREHTGRALRQLQRLHKGRFVPGCIGHQRAREDGMLAQQRIDLAGHEAAKTGDAAVAHLGPFAVRARQHHAGAAQTAERQGAENLHLFAAHHVVQRPGQAFVALHRQAGHDGQAAGLQPQQLLREFVQAGRAGAVGGLLPALAAAHHAREQAQRIGGLQPVAKAFGQHVRKAPRRDGEDATRKGALLQRLAGGVQPRAAQAAGAPVDGHQRPLRRLRVAHGCNRASAACTAAGVGSGATAPRPCTDSAAAALA